MVQEDSWSMTLYDLKRLMTIHDHLDCKKLTTSEITLKHSVFNMYSVLFKYICCDSRRFSPLFCPLCPLGRLVAVDLAMSIPKSH